MTSPWGYGTQAEQQKAEPKPAPAAEQIVAAMIHADFVNELLQAGHDMAIACRSHGQEKLAARWVRASLALKAHYERNRT